MVRLRRTGSYGWRHVHHALRRTYFAPGRRPGILAVQISRHGFSAQNSELSSPPLRRARAPAGPHHHRPTSPRHPAIQDLAITGEGSPQANAASQPAPSTGSPVHGHPHTHQRNLRGLGTPLHPLPSNAASRRDGRRRGGSVPEPTGHQPASLPPGPRCGCCTGSPVDRDQAVSRPGRRTRSAHPRARRGRPGKPPPPPAPRRSGRPRRPGSSVGSRAWPTAR